MGCVGPVVVVVVVTDAVGSSIRQQSMMIGPHRCFVTILTSSTVGAYDDVSSCVRSCWRCPFRKSSQNHGLRNVDTGHGVEDPHSLIDLLLMRGTLLRHVEQRGV